MSWLFRRTPNVRATQPLTVKEENSSVKVNSKSQSQRYSIPCRFQPLRKFYTDCWVSLKKNDVWKNLYSFSGLQTVSLQIKVWTKINGFPRENVWTKKQRNNTANHYSRCFSFVLLGDKWQLSLSAQKVKCLPSHLTIKYVTYAGKSDDEAYGNDFVNCSLLIDRKAKSTQLVVHW